MRHMKHDVRICRDERGTVLMVVLVSLLITIIFGIVLMKSSVVESKIAGNDLKSQKDFYTCEAAGEIAKAKFDEIMSMNTQGLDENNRTLDISAQVNGTGQVKGAKVTLTYLRSTNPPINSGTSPSSGFANYYVIESTVNGKTIKKGVWKAFPRAQE